VISNPSSFKLEKNIYLKNQGSAKNSTLHPDIQKLHEDLIILSPALKKTKIFKIPENLLKLSKKENSSTFFK
jgi:hypothetical protein